MQQMLTSKDHKDARTYPSAFQPVGVLAKSSADAGKKRDSGYGSDVSPAGLKTQSRRFTFDEDDVDSELCQALDEIDISADEDVFVDHFEPLIQVINECDESDETDKEVEELFDEYHSENTVSENVQIRRPPAPLPTPDVNNGSDITHSADGSRDLCLIASPFYHTNWNTNDRHICKNPFRPIVSRSVGTQTPNPHCQLVQDALRSKKVTLRRGRLRLQSDSEQVFYPLPDVVPISRDRSISLPDVPSFHEHEQHVGRELRRISDDFHSVYLRRHRRQRTRSEEPSTSSRFSVDLPGYWNSLRRFVSSSPIFQAWSRENH
ncbi:uncharacterized protein LOC123523910 [Mercenaria mercenaria]|uniref:uncharacterized protein LOC123523910 n=1 Tax=Mercenaria mercenaria TaxID=6596 RepID=UPI00234EFD06|nr:uncharacterized protein LOC123523910 [Mercenaria mercenaria]